jgi:hypothetical protein
MPPRQIQELKDQFDAEMNREQDKFTNSGELDQTALNRLVDMKRRLDALRKDWGEGELEEPGTE